MFVLIIWIIGAIIAGTLANSKGRSVVGWVVGSILLSPLIVIALFFLSPLDTQKKKCTSCGKMNSLDAKMCRTCGKSFDNASTDYVIQSQAGIKKCPYCAETIKEEAKLCRFCGKDLSSPI